jgi:hypothetical protein
VRAGKSERRAPSEKKETMRKSALFTIILGLLIAPAIARAQSVYSDTYVIPAVSHTAGQNGTWMSDVTINNFRSTQLTVQLIFVESGENNADNIFPVTTSTINGSVTVPAFGTIVLRDVVNGYRGLQNVSGALILGGDNTFAVTSRSYLTAANGTTVGQTVTPARDFFDNTLGRSDNTQVAIIPGIIRNASTRTNIGLVAGAGSAADGPFIVQVTIRDASGNPLGSRLITVPPGNFTQTQFSVASITSTPFDVGSAEIKLVQGSGAVVPYASVIDNTTGSPMYIMGQFPANTPIAKTGFAGNIFSNLFQH